MKLEKFLKKFPKVPEMIQNIIDYRDYVTGNVPMNPPRIGWSDRDEEIKKLWKYLKGKEVSENKELMRDFYNKLNRIHNHTVSYAGRHKNWEKPEERRKGILEETHKFFLELTEKD